MADNAFDGATATWDPVDPNPGEGVQTLGFITSITDDVTAAEIDVTGSSDSQHLFESGIPSESVTVELVGQVTDTTATLFQIGAGDNGVLAVGWPDSGTEGTIAVGTIFALSVSGTMDGPITSSLTIRPGVEN